MDIIHKLLNIFFKSKEMWCPLCICKMWYSSAPSTGWYCSKCSYVKADDGQEYFDGNNIN